MKKSQLSNIFVYLLTIIVVSFILIYGYTQIAKIREQGKKAAYIKFETELGSIVETSISYGNVRLEEVEVPAGYREVCFVSSYPSILSSLSGTNHPIIENSVESKAKKNIFLVEKITKESFFIDKIKVSGDLICIPNTAGRLRIKLEGKGDHVEISTY